MTNNAHIIHASNQISQNGFEDFYHNLVEYFAANGHDNLSYPQFANRTNRATKALLCEKEAIFYTVAFAWQHYTSLQYLLQQSVTLSTDTNEAISMRVIDYGCGQGVATLALMDLMAAQNLAKGSHLAVYLIEPSAISLSIAQYLIERLATVHDIKVDIFPQQCELADAQLPNDNAYPETFHLMLNILDIVAVQQSLDGITKQIQQMSGSHFLFASSPMYGGYEGEKNNTQLGFESLKQAMQPSQVDVYYDTTEWLNYNLYRVMQSGWGNHRSLQRLMAVNWEHALSNVA